MSRPIVPGDDRREQLRQAALPFFEMGEDARWSLAQFIDAKLQWSRETFGPGKRPKGVLAHIRKELVEIAERPDDLDEWIDVVLLALDGAGRQGFSGEQIVDALIEKQRRNKARHWPDWRTKSDDEPIEHVRGEGE